MPPKDILEKTLEAYNDVFADICNGLIHEGLPIITPDSLSDAQPYSFYKADGKIRTQERDVSKFINNAYAIHIAKMGKENQTIYDPYLSLRVIGFDGADYRNQYEDKHHYPVFTIVLYFGEEPWGPNRKLSDIMDIPEGMEPYFNDYKLNVFEIAFLTDEQINRFHSDFRAIADLIAHRRVDPDYIPPADSPEFEHPDAVRQLMAVITGDDTYLEEDLPPERRSKKMDQYVKRFMDKGREEERAAFEEKDKMRVRNLHEMGLSPEKIAQGMDIDLAVVKEWLAAPAMA